mmetsp:Transcript_527/g.887  ORF Transcript_527/g.887 Transcript_527/m.887 type:complete len:204 (+) Transcript_527:1158-1769(+)
MSTPFRPLQKRSERCSFRHRLLLMLLQFHCRVKQMLTPLGSFLLWWKILLSYSNYHRRDCWRLHLKQIMDDINQMIALCLTTLDLACLACQEVRTCRSLSIIETIHRFQVKPLGRCLPLRHCMWRKHSEQLSWSNNFITCQAAIVREPTEGYTAEQTAAIACNDTAIVVVIINRTPWQNHWLSHQTFLHFTVLKAMDLLLMAP